MVTYVLYGLFILTCLVLVVAVLLQPGKAGAGDLFSSNVSSTAFGPRGTQTLLAKITIGAAALFMLIALLLSLPIFGTRSVLQSTPDESQPTASPTPQQQPSPAATVAPPSGATTVPAADGNSNAPASSNSNATTPATPAGQQQPASSPQASPAQK
ncbi:MAG TPA: preprotein translocase subunit SecG [Pyrinomonadaceae bacterium]|nr:preprotein translocase subunit SecG [Pyrinomonadaceae bacterium]